jgi:hypothetical protein
MRNRDKRIYEFKTLNNEVATSRPDQTFVLSTYHNEDWDYQCGLRRTQSKCQYRRIHPCFDKFRLELFARLGQVNLLVDPKWGEVDFIFSWVDYEAKAAATTKLHGEAKQQGFLAAQVYLGMLDDLARNPYDLQYYQNRDSKEY